MKFQHNKQKKNANKFRCAELSKRYHKFINVTERARAKVLECANFWIKRNAWSAWKKSAHTMLQNTIKKKLHISTLIRAMHASWTRVHCLETSTKRTFDGNFWIALFYDEIHEIVIKEKKKILVVSAVKCKLKGVGLIGGDYGTHLEVAGPYCCCSEQLLSDKWLFHWAALIS